ncbi:Division initiation protein DivIB [Alloiococcus otitis]|uniref:POTRA domain-containing protein n=1 Tax=Alloiococcus otitis ATCC 51267 TaxID=883081 RepID=K9EAZ6_9LACT|nr:FtsQ-type POTRA domain-containing protein [Alloiococcus otitis]EKU94384.1 hypothetical protein HMPREF9698_00112 [Alloiococcus otitis ATCC 51267]SUU81286.1 Division initiation protein DivIB [Alloiococcus otitis]
MVKTKGKFGPQSKKISRIKATSLILAFSLVFLASFYLLSPLNKIETIQVEGNEKVSDEEVIQSSGLQPASPMVETWLDRSYFGKALLDREDYIQAVTIRMEDYQTLGVKVEEYDLLGQIHVDAEEGSEDLYDILENKDLTPAQDPRNSVPLLLNFEPESDLFDQLLGELKETNDSVLSQISEIEWLDLDRNPKLLKLNMTDGNQVLINVPYFARRINYYPQLTAAVDNVPGIFDLEAGSFFRPFGQEEAGESDHEQDSGGQEKQEDAQDQEVNPANPEDQERAPANLVDPPQADSQTE